jgi:hypothetical protein
LDPTHEKLKDMEEDGIIVKEDEHTPWVSSMLVIDKRKGKDKNCMPSKDNVRICIDPRNLNRALKQPHYPMATVEEIGNWGRNVYNPSCMQQFLATSGG